MPSELLKSDPAVQEALLRKAKPSVKASDFTNWEDVLKDPKNDPRPYMRRQNQKQNDCQAHSACTGNERRWWYVSGGEVDDSSGKVPQRSDTFAYNASEYIMSPNQVGKDGGTWIEAGVTLQTEGIPSIGVGPGIPLETDWPYGTYERSASRFVARAKKVKLQDGLVTEHRPAPDSESLLAGLAAGGNLHQGTFWPFREGSQINGKKVMAAPPTRGGGHATTIIWAEMIRSDWYFISWNSHNDEYFYVPRKVYDQLAKMKYEPFGAYLLLPDKPVERYYKRTQAGGGYIL